MSFDFEFGSFRKTVDANRAWWNGLSVWLKLIYVFAAIPAWLFIAFCVVTGRDKSLGAIVAFGVFAACGILHLIFDPRNRRAGGSD